MKQFQAFKLVFLIWFPSALLLIGCSSGKKDNHSKSFSPGLVHAIIETPPINSSPGEDAADDPAIWIHPDSRSKSVIFGSNKKGGICAYGLDGSELAFYPAGNINNIDIRYNFPLQDNRIDILGGTNRSDSSIALFQIDKHSGRLQSLHSDIRDIRVGEVYGFCFYVSPITGSFYANLVGKTGLFEQWELSPGNGPAIQARKVRTFHVGGIAEGMVCDDEIGWMYIAAERKGIWKYNAEPDAGSDRKLIPFTDSTNLHISYDLEGLTIYYASEQSGYLIASVQGNNTFAIYERDGDNNYITSFSITKNGIDGVTETDGIDITNVYLNHMFPGGLFVAQDGNNMNGGNFVNQNFKLVSWPAIAELTEPPLIIDTTRFTFKMQSPRVP
jgi:3-phytase